MRTNKEESELRRELASAMVGQWLMTWHEDREISPGVPDLHFVMRDHSNDKSAYETGWLELKACEEFKDLHIEPSQHQYMTKWASYIPIWFLVRYRENIYLISGLHHHQLAASKNVKQLTEISSLVFAASRIGTELPPFLKLFTKK